MLQVLAHLIQLLKSDFIALKADVDKLDNNELATLPTGLNNLKTKVDGFDVGKLKTLPIDQIDKLEIVKQAVSNRLNMNVINSEIKSPNVSTLMETNQNNTRELNLQKKLVKLGIMYLTLVVY